MVAPLAARSGSETRAGETDLIWLLALIVLGAVLSMMITGYIFGLNNNGFHLPILERLYNEPQFRDDAFIQSLRYYAAGPFVLLEGSARFVAPETLFPILIFLSHALTFTGLLLCARELGVESRTAQFVFVVLISFMQFMRGYSYAGDGGLFIDTFTHSEIANGLLLISLYFAARGRFTAAFVVNGLVFFTNAFMAVWNAAPLGLIILFYLRDRELSWGQVARQCALGLLGFVVLAAPVLWNIWSNPEFGRPIGFDYPAYLREYWPLHFLFETNPMRERLALGGLMVLGVMAFVAIGPRGRRLHAALWGFALVYGVGIVVPWFTSSPVILNLHLLRSSAALQLLIGLASVALTTQWLLGHDGRLATVIAPLMAVSLCSIRVAAIATPFLIAAGLAPRLLDRMPTLLLRRRKLIVGGAATLLVAFWAIQIIRVQRAEATTRVALATWRELGEWARRSTDPAAVFMVPTRRLTANGPAGIDLGSDIFEFVSHRREWIDYKSGAAVMWSPSFYAVWHERVTAQLALPDLDAKLVFARRNGIAFVIDRCQTQGPAAPVFGARDLCVYPAGPQVTEKG